jgi:hypothetical protein
MMRMMMTASFPLEPFNTMVRNGSAGSTLKKILADLKPEASWFVEEDGKRSGVFIIEVADQSRIPSFSEPFFLLFNAECRFRIAMTPDDLGRAGLDELGKKWK